MVEFVDIELAYLLKVLSYQYLGILVVTKFY